MAGKNINKFGGLKAEDRRKQGSKSGRIGIIILLTIQVMHCSTVAFVQKRVPEDFSQGKFSMYEKALEESEVTMLQECGQGGLCESFEGPDVPEGKYYPKRLSNEEFRLLLESGKKCRVDQEARNRFFLNESKNPAELNDAIQTMSISQMLTEYDNFAKQMRNSCNCVNEVKGLGRRSQCIVPIYDPSSDNKGKLIAQLLRQQENSLTAKEREQRTKDEEEAWKKSEPARKAARKLAERALKTESRDITATPCRDDKPIRLIAIDGGKLVQCVVGQDRNTLETEFSEQYFHLVSLGCIQRGTNDTELQYQGAFKISKSRKKYSFLKTVNTCEK